MNRRIVLGALCAFSLLLLLGMSRRSAQYSRARARTFLLWAEAAQDRIPHTGVVRTAMFLPDKTVTTDAVFTRLGPRLSRTEYLSPSMRGVIVVEEGDHTWRYDPARRRLYDEGPSRMGVGQRSQHLNLILRNYEARLLGRARVAQRNVQRMVLANRYDGSIARRLWVDEDTGLVLRSEEYRSDGALLTRTAYQEVRYGVPGNIAAAPQIAAERVVRVQNCPVPAPQLTEHLGSPLVRPRYVPQGFEYEGCYLGGSACACGKPTAQMRYSDGIRAISVFQCADHPREATDAGVVIPLPQGGMVRSYRPNGLFILIGEPRPDDLRRMAESLP